MSATADILGIVASPALGLILGFCYMVLVAWLFRPSTPSTRSVLILWVEAFEANACILGGKLPGNTALFGMAFVLPRLRFLS
jgi:hypothetical protein